MPAPIRVSATGDPGWQPLTFAGRDSSLDSDVNGISQLAGGAVAEANGSSIRFSITRLSGGANPNQGCVLMWRHRDQWGRALTRLHLSHLAILVDGAPAINSKVGIVAGWCDGDTIASDTTVWGGLHWDHLTNVRPAAGTGGTASNNGTDSANWLHALITYQLEADSSDNPHVRSLCAAPFDASYNGQGSNGAAGNTPRVNMAATDPHVFLAVYPTATMASTETVDIQLYHKTFGAESGTMPVLL